jgi:hypothetical protein
MLNTNVKPTFNKGRNGKMNRSFSLETTTMIDSKLYEVGIVFIVYEETLFMFIQ